ncbi:MAG: hypothetical protein ACE5KG_04950 [Nitrososphaerales archaeon]
MASSKEISCPICAKISKDRKGVCPTHLLAPVDRQTMEEAEKRSHSLIKRYIIQSSRPLLRDIPEVVSEKAFLSIQGMKEQLNMKTFDDVLDYLGKELAFRADPDRTLQTRRPLIITGPPETGKTLLAKKLLKRFDKVFVVDVSNEYSGLKMVHSGELFGDIWRKEKGIRIVPNPNPILSRFEMDYLFGYLVAKMKEPDSPMRQFCFVIEDAVRFSDNQAIKSFIGESRKFVRKTIIICQDIRAYEGMGEVIKP